MVPESRRDKQEELLRFAGIRKPVDLWAGSAIFLALLFALLAGVTFVGLTNYAPDIVAELCCNKFFPYIVGVVVLSFVLFAINIHIRVLISIRAERAEEAFPDFLYNVATNLKGGMTPLQAFFASAKPQFPVIGEEARRAYQTSLASGSLSEAFDELAKSIASPYIQNFAVFFKRAIMSGGKTAELIENYADHLRDILSLKRDLKQKTNNYVAFIFLTSALIMPFLFALAYNYISSAMHLAASLGEIGQIEELPISFKPKISLKISDFYIMIYTYIFIAGIITSILMSLLRKGKTIYASKYVLFIWLTSILVFYLSQISLKAFLMLS